MTLNKHLEQFHKENNIPILTEDLMMSISISRSLEST